MPKCGSDKCLQRALKRPVSTIHFQKLQEFALFVVKTVSKLVKVCLSNYLLNVELIQ